MLSSPLIQPCKIRERGNRFAILFVPFHSSEREAQSKGGVRRKLVAFDRKLGFCYLRIRFSQTSFCSSTACLARRAISSVAFANLIIGSADSFAAGRPP